MPILLLPDIKKIRGSKESKKINKLQVGIEPLEVKCPF